MMIRILHCVNDMHRAGLETLLMNYYRKIDRTKIQFDFLTHRPERSDYDDEIESLGGRVFYAPRLYPQNYPAYFRYMREFFLEHPEYQIVHSHIDSMSYLPLLAAKRAGIPIRIAHSHNTSIDKDFKYPLKQLFRFLIPGVATHYLACGKKAGQYLFRNNNYQVIPNAVHAKSFFYNADVRTVKREELELGDEIFLIGHVGRFTHQKNHDYLIQIFYEIQKRDKDARLLLVGVGEKEEEIRNKIRLLNIEDKVIFLGNRSDVAELYQAMDVFLLPSLYEGLPLVGVEAQFADLPCFFSDTITKEVSFHPECRFMDIHGDPVIWAEAILAMKFYKRSSEKKEIQNSVFDIETAHKILIDYYINIVAQF